MQARYRVVDLSNVDAFEVVGLARLTKAPLIVDPADIIASVVTELSIHRLYKAELASVVHFHCVFLGAVHHGVLRRCIVSLYLIVWNYTNFST